MRKALMIHHCILVTRITLSRVAHPLHALSLLRVTGRSVTTEPSPIKSASTPNKLRPVGRRNHFNLYDDLWLVVILTRMRWVGPRPPPHAKFVFGVWPDCRWLMEGDGGFLFCAKQAFRTEESMFVFELLVVSNYCRLFDP